MWSGNVEHDEFGRIDNECCDSNSCEFCNPGHHLYDDDAFDRRENEYLKIRENAELIFPRLERMLVTGDPEEINKDPSRKPGKLWDALRAQYPDAASLLDECQQQIELKQRMVGRSLSDAEQRRIIQIILVKYRTDPEP